MKEQNLEVLIERLDNLFKVVEERFAENKETHLQIVERLDHTNGNVRALQLWRSATMGAVGVLLVLVVPIILEIWKGHFGQ